MADHSLLSRRSLVVTAAAVAALPAAAPVLSHNPDAELLRLDAELEQRWRVWWGAYGPAMDAVNDAEEEARRRHNLGREPTMSMSDDEFRTWWKLSEAVREEYNVWALNSVVREAWPPLEELCQRLLHTPATTLQGMAVKARATAVLKHEMWWSVCSSDSSDDTEAVFRQLIEQMIAAGGLQMPADLVQT